MENRTITALLLLFSVGVGAAEAFDLLNNASSEFYALAYVAMFAIAFVGAKNIRRHLPTWVVVASWVGAITSAVVLVLNAYPFVDVASPLKFAEKIVSFTLVCNVVGYAFYRSRKIRPAALGIE